MTTRLEDLKPSTQAPIPADVLRELPLGGIYLWPSDSSTETSRVFRLEEWDGSLFRYRWPSGEAWGGPQWCEVGIYEIHYPKLPRMSFALTADAISTPGDQPSGRQKSVTRRGSLPRWCKPGRLFLAVDKLRFTNDQPASRGLGVFRVVSAERQGRWRCPDCNEEVISATVRAKTSGVMLAGVCELCGGHRASGDLDRLTYHELALEGFPDMDPDKFWAMLEKGGQVRGGKTWRIAFAAVP